MGFFQKQPPALSPILHDKLILKLDTRDISEAICDRPQESATEPLP